MPVMKPHAKPAPNFGAGTIQITAQSSQYPGQYISGSWSSSTPALANDYIGLYLANNMPKSGLGLPVTAQWWRYVPVGATSGTFSTLDYTNSAPWDVPFAGGGPWAFAYMSGGSFGSNQVATSSPVYAVSTPTSMPVSLQCRAPGTTASNIKHVVLVVQENHSFDAYFGRYCTAPTGSRPTCHNGTACCEAAPATVGGLSPIVLNDAANKAFDPNHTQLSELCKQDGGKMDQYLSNSPCTGADNRNWAIADSTTLAVYYDYARKYAMSDMFFQSAAGQSSMNDMYFARGAWVFDDNSVEPKSAKYGTGCIYNEVTATYRDYYDLTIGDLLVKCGVTFGVYIEGYAYHPTGPASCYPLFYDASDIPFAYYPSLVDKYFFDFSQFSVDVANGNLPAYSYVKALGTHQEHPYAGDITDGTAFTSNIVNIINNSPIYSKNTLILLTADESGGFYDHYPPPQTANPIDNKPYGPRVWFIAAGYFAKQNYISHVQIEAASTIKFVEWNFLAGGTGQLNTRDTNVNNIGDLLDPAKTGVTVPSN